MGVLVTIDDFGLEQKGGISGVPGYTWRQKTQVQSWLFLYKSQDLGQVEPPFLHLQKEGKGNMYLSGWDDLMSRCICYKALISLLVCFLNGGLFKMFAFNKVFLIK